MLARAIANGRGVDAMHRGIRAPEYLSRDTKIPLRFPLPANKTVFRDPAAVKLADLSRREMAILRGAGLKPR